MNAKTRLSIIITVIVIAFAILALHYGVRWISQEAEAAAARAQQVQLAKARERQERQMERIRSERMERETETTEAKRERMAEARERAAAAFEKWLEDGRPSTGSPPMPRRHPAQQRATTVDFCQSTQRLEQIMFGGWAFVSFNGSLRPVGNNLPKAILDAADQWAVGTPRTIELRRTAAMAGACP